MNKLLEKAKEIKWMVAGLDCRDKAERLEAVEYIYSMVEEYGEDNTNIILDEFSNNFSDFYETEGSDCLYVDEGQLYEIYNGDVYEVTGDDTLCHLMRMPKTAWVVNALEIISHHDQ